MDKVYTIERCLQILAGFDQYHEVNEKELKSSDVNLIRSLGRQVLRKTPLTDRQYDLAIKKFNDYFHILFRFGIDKTFQKKGVGRELLSYILSFAKAKNFKKMKLNTQSTNQAALSLYTNNTFEVLEKKLVIMGSASHKQE